MSDIKNINQFFSYIRYWMFLLATIGLTGCSVENEGFVENDVNEATVRSFVETYNASIQNGVIQADNSNKTYLSNIVYWKDQETFTALSCSHLPCEAESGVESMFRLIYADINNDSIKEYTLVAVGEGTVARDIIIEVYMQQGNDLVSLDYYTTIEKGFGIDGAKNWPYYFDEPFLKITKGLYSMNYQGFLIYKDEQGIEVEKHLKHKIRFIETPHYRYVWEGNDIKLTDSYITKVARSMDGP